MARPLSAIQLQITQFIASQPALSGLTSTSSTSVWKQFADAIASSQQTTEQLADIQEARMNQIADEAVPGTPAWLQRRVLDFQYGDAIQLNSDLTLTYANEDASKKIITHCSVQEATDTREVLLKVAKGTTGNLSPLTIPEKQGLVTYLNRVKFAGIQLAVVSLPGDRIVTGVDVYYDPQYVVADVKQNVIDAITNFYNNLTFNGVLLLSVLTDAIQKITGVVDVQLTGVVARAATTPVTAPGLRTIVRKYETQSGYLVVETQAGYSLDDTVNMIASN